MRDMKEITQRIKDSRRAIEVQKGKLQRAEDELVLQRVKRPRVSERRIRECESAVKVADAELKRFEDLLKSIEGEKALARKEQENVETLTLEQMQLVATMEKESKELLKMLRAAQEINAKILELNSRYLILEKQTGKTVDRARTSGGLRSLSTLLDILDSEVAGRGRQMFFFTHKFPV